MRQITTFYNKHYYAKTITASMRKLPHIAKAISELDIVTLKDTAKHFKGDIFRSLLQLHDPKYVKQFIRGEGDLAESQGFEWTEEIRNGVLMINRGMICAAETAFKEGIAANIAQGFHHAGYKKGSGFCTFNGLALVAQEFPDKKVMVIDTDEHQGNGTMEFVERLPNLYNATIYGSYFGGNSTNERNREWDFKEKPVTDSFDVYMDAVMDALGLALETWKPDLIIYQAGADPHINDPLGTLGITTEQMMERDRTVFEFTRDFDIPVLFVMAGGYQSPIKNTVELHVNTFKAASEVYSEAANKHQWEITK